MSLYGKLLCVCVVHVCVFVQCMLTFNLTNVLIWQAVVCMCVQCYAISYEIKIR